MNKIGSVNKDIKFNKKRIDIFLLASIVGVLNVLFSTNFVISLIIVFLEIIILMYHFVKRNIIDYLGNYLIFLCLSFEFSLLVGNENFYGFKNFRILGVNLGIITLLPILILFFININKVKFSKLVSKSKKLYIFIKSFLILNLIGVFMGLFQILVNDNNVQMMDGVLNSFISVFYNFALLPFLLLIALIFIINFENNNIERLEDYLIAIFIGLVASMLTSLLTSNYGHYGGVDILLVSNVYRYIPFMLIFPFYNKNNKMIFWIGLLGAILTFIFNLNGKMLILYLLIPIGILIIEIKKRNLIMLLLILIVIIISIPILNNIFDILFNESVLFRSKFMQVKRLLIFWDVNWFESIPDSPKVRLVEFINIVKEYINKPWYFIFGKGYMGTFTDYTGFFNTEIPASYSMNQWNSGIFFRVHETFNSLFLFNGLIGLIFYFYMIKVIFLNLYKTPWILVGGFWFVMVYGYSFTMTAFGLTALVIGLIKIDKKTIGR